MAIKLGKKNKRYTVELQGATFTGEVMSTSERAKLREKHTSYRRNVPIADETAVLTDRFVKSIKDWSGVVDEDENGELKAMDCTIEKKREFVELNFSDAVVVLNAIDEQAENESRVEFENLGE